MISYNLDLNVLMIEIRTWYITIFIFIVFSWPFKVHMTSNKLLRLATAIFAELDAESEYVILGK